MPSVMRGATVIAHAKINLALHVTGRRRDGYHLLDSLVVRTAFGDQISLTQSTADRIDISGPFSEQLALTSEADNLISHARDRLRSLMSDKTSPVKIALEKNLPIASGIGGGSADAAATLHGLMQLWDLSLDQAKLDALALSLGADVPMCLRRTPIRARGIGEHVIPAPHLAAIPIVLVNSGDAISTPMVFSAMEDRDNPPIDMPDGWPNQAAFTDWLASATRNDLYKPASRLCPSIECALDALRSSGAQIARMSGSGATCFGLYCNQQAANKAADRLAQAKPEWFVIATATLPSSIAH